MIKKISKEPNWIYFRVFENFRVDKFWGFVDLACFREINFRENGISLAKIYPIKVVAISMAVEILV